MFIYKKKDIKHSVIINELNNIKISKEFTNLCETLKEKKRKYIEFLDSMMYFDDDKDLDEFYEYINHLKL